MSSIPENLRELVSRIKVPTPTGPKGEPARQRTIQAIHEIVALYVSGDIPLRLSIIEATEPYLVQLLEFARYMAVLSVRERNINLVREGLTALVIENCRSDYRDSIAFMSLLSHSARKLGAVDNDLITEALAIAQLKCSKYLNEFLQRDDENRSIELMGYAESVYKGEFVYIQISPL